MAIVYLDCSETYSDIDHVCNPCVDPELGNIRSVAFIKPGTTIDFPLSESQWTAQILAGNIKIIPATRGTFDGGTAKMGTGYGDVKERKLGVESVLAFKDPDFKDNSGKGGFWEMAEKQEWNIAWRTETLLHYVDAKVTISEKAPITEDLESEVVSEIECKWISSSKPQIGDFAPLADLFKCFEVDIVHVTGIAIDETLSVSEDAVYYNLNNLLTWTPSDATNKLVTWASSNENVLTIDNNGVAFLKAAGTSTVTVTTNDGGYSDTCAVTVQSGD